MNINLLQSCKFGKIADVSSFLQQARASNKDVAAILNSVLDKENGKSSLHYAAESGHEDLVGLLLDQGANINIQNPKNGSTPLHLASFYGHSSVVSLLMKRGCNPNVPNNHQVTALHAACDNNKIACVEALIKGGANMESKDKKGATPLHYAVAQGNKETVEFLCKSGAYVNSVDQHQQTPLMWAGKSNQLSSVGQVLIQYGADVNATDKNGLSLTMDAKFRRQLAGFLKSGNTPTASNTIYSGNQSRPAIDLNMFEKKPGSPAQPQPTVHQPPPQFPTVPSSPTPSQQAQQPVTPQPQPKPPMTGAVPVFPTAPTTQHTPQVAVPPQQTQQPAPQQSAPVPVFPSVPSTPTSPASSSNIPTSPSFAPVPVPTFHSTPSEVPVPGPSLGGPSIPTPQFATLRPSQTQPPPTPSAFPDFPVAPTMTHSKTEPLPVFPDPPKEVAPPLSQSKSETSFPVFPDPPKDTPPKLQLVETPIHFAEAAEEATVIPIPVFEAPAPAATPEPTDNNNSATTENAGQDTAPVNKQTEKLSKSVSRSSLDSTRLAEIQRRKSTRPIKEGHLWVKVGRIRKTWKIFWFVLEDTSLSYYANPQSPKPTKSYAFSGETYAKDSPGKKADENIQFIFFTGKKARRFEAESKDMKLEWIAAINSVGGQNKSGLKGPDSPSVPIRKSFDSKMLDIDEDDEDEEALQIANLEIARVDVESVN